VCVCVGGGHELVHSNLLLFNTHARPTHALHMYHALTHLPPALLLLPPPPAQHLERWFQEQGAIKSSGRVRRDRSSAMSLMGSNSGGGNSGNSSNSDSGGRLLGDKAAWSADSSDDTTRSVVTSVAGGATHSALSSPAGNENANGYVKDSLIESPNPLA
jgi:hypothetical protein